MQFCFFFSLVLFFLKSQFYEFLIIFVTACCNLFLILVSSFKQKKYPDENTQQKIYYK